MSDGNGLKIASLLDLAGTKASVVQVRPEAKDYIDLDMLIKQAQQVEFRPLSGPALPAK